MKGYAMLKIGESGWIREDRPACGPMDAICKPLAVAICTSDVHTLWEGAIGDRHNMILGHECCAEVVEVGSMVKDFKPGDRVLVPAITPDWNSLEAQAGYLHALRRYVSGLEILQLQRRRIFRILPCK